MGIFSYGKSLTAAFPFVRQEGARHALFVLFLVNLLNFADRYIPAAVKTEIKDDLHLTDFETSLPNSGMVLVFMISAVAFGHLADKQVYDRRMILCGGVIFWSLATSVAGLSQNLWQLILFRSLVGVGEAAYGTVAAPFISDLYPKRDRNVAYGIYYLAIPVGGALGFAIGGLLGGMFGWRWAFVACGLPGLVVAFAILKLYDPVRGINDEYEEYVGEECESDMLIPPTSSFSDDGRGLSKDNIEKIQDVTTNPVDRTSFKAHSSFVSSSDSKHHSDPSVSMIAEYCEILSNKQYMAGLAGLTANNFALGGLADWAITYCERYENASVSEAGLVIGAATVVGGILGTVIGTKLVQHYDGKVKSSCYLVCGICSIPAAIFFFVALNSDSKILTYTWLFCCEILIWICFSPVYAMCLTVVPVSLRARASGLLIFIQHILGDVISPPLIGYISDRTGSLRTALQICWMATFLQGFFYLGGYYFLDPLPVSENAAEDALSKNSLHSNLLGEMISSLKPLTYSEVLLPVCCTGVPDDDESMFVEAKHTLIKPNT